MCCLLLTTFPRCWLDQSHPHKERLAPRQEQGGVQHVLSDGQYGRLVPAGDADMLAAAMGQLVAHPEEAAALGAAAQARSLDYSAERMGDAYLALYADVVTAERGTH
jgi:hypothetical protein